MLIITLDWSAFLKLSAWLSFSLIAILFSVKAQSEPLGQEIKEILRSDLDRATAMQRKLDLVRERLADKRGGSAKPQISQFLQLERDVDCQKDESALMRALDSDTEASIVYLISGRCVIDRPLEVIGRSLTIGSLNSSQDPSTSPEDLASLYFDQQISGIDISVATGASIILGGLFLESSSLDGLSFNAYNNGSLGMVDIGFRSDLELRAFRGGVLTLYDLTNVLPQFGREPTQAQNALAATYSDTQLDYSVFSGSSAFFWGANLDVSFFLEGGAVLDHFALPQNSEGSTASYELRNGSTATIRHYFAPITVSQAKISSNSNLGFYGVFQPQELIVSPTSYFGPPVD